MPNNRHQQNSSHYPGLDFAKFFMAICVVLIHIRGLNSGWSPGETANYIIALAVPFFFICSGFLLANKIQRNAPEDKAAIIKGYAMRIWRMFLCWIAIYIPLSLWSHFAMPTEDTFVHFAFVQIRSALLLGSISYSYPTWYLYSLAIGTSAFYLFVRRNLSPVPLFIIGLAGILMEFLTINYKFGYLIDNGMVSLSTMTRGAGYMFIGYWLAYHRSAINTGLSLAGIIISILLWYLNLPYWQLAGSIAVFCPAYLCKSQTGASAARWMREESQWIYLLHMYVLTPLFYFHPYSSPWIMFAIATPVCIALSQIMISLSRSEHGRFLKKLV